MYIYGGVYGQHIESRLWIYNMTSRTWHFNDFGVNDAVAGHTAVVVDQVMYVIFGHSPVYGYLNTVQMVALDQSKAFVFSLILKTFSLQGNHI